MTDLQRDVLRVLCEHGPQTTIGLARRLGRAPNAIGRAMNVLLAERYVVPWGGSWKVRDTAAEYVRFGSPEK